MKIAGVDPKTLNPEYTLVLPRGEAILVFKARGIPSMDEFQKLCPEPVPPRKQTKDGLILDTKNPNYVNDLKHYSERRLAYMVIKSLEPSEIEWESADLAIPGSWVNWKKDMTNAGFSEIECNRVVGLVLEANCLDETKLKQAREVFLRGPQEELNVSTYQTTEPESSPSGEPVNA